MRENDRRAMNHYSTHAAGNRSIAAHVGIDPAPTGERETLLSDGEQTRVAAALDASYGGNTARAYQWGWSAWSAWAAKHGAHAIPAAPDMVAAFLAARGETTAPASVHLACSGIAAGHRAVGLPDPTVDDRVRRVLKGVPRTDVGGRGQVRGIDWQQADHMAAVAADDGSTCGLRDAALIRVMSDALLRVSEASNLNADDLSTADDESGTLVVQYSKTDQEGTGRVQYVGRPTMDALRRYLTACDVASGPLFRRIDKAGTVGDRLSSRSMRAIIQRRAEAAGIEGRVSGHSLRVGSAQSLAAAGASLVQLQVAGRWKSPTMPAYYARHQLAALGAVATLRYGAHGTLRR